MGRGVFFDRDDTLIDTRSATIGGPHAGDLADAEFVELMPGALDACRALAGAGFVLIGVSNQGAVARGVATVEQVHAVNQRACALLPAAEDERVRGEPGLLIRERGAYITLPEGPSLLRAIYFCPFHPEGAVPEYTREHPWRKPAPGMILAAAADFDLDLSRSWLVGDQERDGHAAAGAGIDARRIIVLGRTHRDLTSACAHILHHG